MRCDSASFSWGEATAIMHHEEGVDNYVEVERRERDARVVDIP